MPLEVTSTAFIEGQQIPTKYTADGQDLSPPISWSGLPAETRSIALICDDPDAPRGTWVHWVLYDLPPDTTQISEGMPLREELEFGAKQGRNDFGNIGYGGPAPPKGKPHRYFFKVYALSDKTDLSAGATKAKLLQAMEGKVLAEGNLMGTYQR